MSGAAQQAEAGGASDSEGTANLRRMLQALDTEAKPALKLIADFETWWTGFTAGIGAARDGLSGARGGLRGGLAGGKDRGWLDQAGDSFDTRWQLADNSLESWVVAPSLDPNTTTALQTQIDTTRQAITAAIVLAEKYDAANAASAAAPGTAAQGEANMAGRDAVPAYNSAVAEFKKLNEGFEATGPAISALVEKTKPWNGPMGSTGYPAVPLPGDTPQRVPAGPGGPSAPGGPTAPSPAATDPTGADPGATPPGGDPQAGATDPAAGGDEAGPELAGSPTLTPPATGMPTLPPGLGTSTPLPQTPFTPPLGGGGIPYPPGTLTPLSPNGKPAKAGLGKSVIGGGNLGGFAVGKHDFGIPASTGRIGQDTSNGPAQAARTMNRSALPSVPQTPTPPATATPASGTAPAGTGSVPPPMMPPMTGGGGDNKPKPGTASPAMHGKGKPPNGMPGVPPKLRGRSGTTGPANGFGVPAAPRRPKTAELDTVELLDEELWAVDQPPSPGTPTVKQLKLRGH